MKVAELIEIGGKMLEMLSKYDIKTSDYKYLELFSDYERMADSGDKTSYIVAVLSEKYSLSEASVYRILRRFRRTLKT